MIKSKFLCYLLLVLSLLLLSGCNNETNITTDNVDKVKPTVVINNPTTADAGIIKIDYVVTDNVTPLEKLKVNIICVKDGMMIEVVNNEFLAEEGI